MMVDWNRGKKWQTSVATCLNNIDKGCTIRRFEGGSPKAIVSTTVFMSHASKEDVIMFLHD